MRREPAEDPAPFQGLFAGGGEAGRLMAAHDWAVSPLGPTGTWPAGLRFAVRTVLASRFPMVLTWGPEFTQFYNDAYAPCIGAKHPAIGEDIRVTLAEGWAALGPPIAHAMATGEASWLPRLPLPLVRAGYREETYFTVSHAPAFADDGTVAGMHAVLTEVTAEVLIERRQRLLHELSTAVGELGDERATAEVLARTLVADPIDVPCAAIYLAEEGGFRRTVVCGAPVSCFPEWATDAGGVAPLAPLGIRGGLWADPVTDAVTLPLGGASAGAPIGLLVVGVNPNRALDDNHRAFHALLAGQVTSTLVDARAFDAERQRAAALVELDRVRTTFFADVSHELRTPLTLLLGPLADAVDGLADGVPVPAGGREQLTMALRNGYRLQRLVDDLLEFVSIESGRADAVRVETDVAGFTAELVSVLRAAAERAGLTLSVDCPPLDRPCFVDPRMWEKIVLNLVSNAIKYTFVGGIAVTLGADADAFVLTVRDTGVGIPAAELPHLFERFFRGRQSSARSREGTGIGLALVQDLVGLHGGTVGVSSEAGAGSTFVVRMPFGAPDVAGRPAVAPSPGAAGVAAPWDTGVQAPSPPTERADDVPTVLVVDDNADMRSYLTRVLSPHWAVRTAGDGEQALAAVAAQLPDLVLTDVMMPGIDGFELLRRLRSDPATASVPVVMLTARAGQEAAVEGLDAGADDYLAKPFRADELTARMRVVLDRSRGHVPAVVPTRVDREYRPARPAEPVTQPLEVPRPPVPVPGAERSPDTSAGEVLEQWRVPSAPRAVPVLRRQLQTLLHACGLDPDRAYDLLLATCEAVTNAVEHAQQPSEPFVDVDVRAGAGWLAVSVRDHGRWRERVPSMDRGRGSMLMSAVAEVTVTPAPSGTTVVLLCRV